jgi:hypothetical protein
MIVAESKVQFCRIHAAARVISRMTRVNDLRTSSFKILNKKPTFESKQARIVDKQEHTRLEPSR